MNLTDLHRRLLADVLAVGGAYPLALTGGYAVQAHGLVDRLSQDLDVATENPESMEDIATAVRIGLEQRGWQVSALETDPLSARLIVTDPTSREECEVDILKEALWRPPVHTEHGLVLSLEDVVGTKVRALSDRGLARDLIDVPATPHQGAPRAGLLRLPPARRRNRILMVTTRRSPLATQPGGGRLGPPPAHKSVAGGPSSSRTPSTPRSPRSRSANRNPSPC